MSKVLEVRNLSHIYDNMSSVNTAAIEDISFSVDSGEIIGIIGHTGSGKTTLVEHLNGLLKPSAGSIYLDGVDIWENKKKLMNLRAQVGLVFQYPEYQLFEETVFKDIAFGPKNIGLKGQELEERVIETCETVGIDLSFLQKSPFDLSGGEKRRVAIAGVMAMRPKVIIFDEPIAGLDPMGRKNVLFMIQKYRSAVNATVLIISHNMDDMALLADKLLVLNKGRLVAFDTTEKIYTNYELLRSIGLNVPTVAEIFNTLRKKGLDVPDNIFTVDDALSYLCKLKAKGVKRKC